MGRVCTIDHSGGAVPKALGGLPESQAGTWRHKCVACAYELGLKDGAATEERLRARVRELDAKVRELEAQLAKR
jgi:hypothetical protein